jgi:hypothetical protein
MITREQIKLFLQNIASSHYNIHTFGWGDVPDLLAREKVIYPYMMVTPVPSTFEDGYINYGYLVSIADRIREGNQNEVEVDSDTFNIMMQVITQIDNLLYNDVDLVKGQTITPFMEAHRHRVSGHFSELQIRVKYNYDACAIPSDEVPLPLPPPPSCAVANYRVEYENGTLIEAGTIPSGGSKTIEVPNPSVCANATWELRDEDGVLLNSGSVASGGSVTIEAPNADLLIRNSLNQTLYNLSLLSGSSGTQTIGDSSIRLEDSVGTLIANSSVVAEGSATITAPDGTVSVRKSDGVEIYSVDVRSNGTASQNVADSVAVIKDSANTTLKSENIKATESEDIVINDSSVENSDASYSVNVLAEGSLVLPDSQINVNSVDSGDVVSVKTIDVNITDGVDPVTPTSVGLVGNTLTIEVPSGGGVQGEFLVRFFDIDGTILKEERRNAGQDATAPTDPDYDPTYLTFAEWNQPFTNVQNDIDVGAIYDTIDGKTYLFLRITNTTGLQPTLAFNKVDTNTLTIDWGDTTSDTTSSNGNINITKTSAYSAIGDYIVTLDCLGIYSNRITVGLFNSSIPYANSLLKAYMGINMRTTTGCFLNCSNMNLVSVNKNITSGFNNFAEKSGIVHINTPTNLISIQNSFISSRKLITISLNKLCTDISGAFNGCSSLEKVVINGITNIGTTSLFNGCSCLREQLIPNSINSLGSFIFQNCTGLQSLLISNTLTSLGSSSIRNCNNLVELEFPNTLTSIAASALQDNLSILEYTFLSTTPPTLANINAFTNINAACKIYVPDASVAAYQAATNWVTYANYIYPLSTKP